MPKFHEVSVFNNYDKKMEAIKMYKHDKKPTGKIAVHFGCTRELVERMLKARGELL